MEQLIKDMADEFALPVSDVHHLLSTEMNHLEQGAHIKQYILLLAIKRVREFLATGRGATVR